MDNLEELLRDILPDDEVDELMRLFQIEMANLEKQLREHLSDGEVEEEMRTFQSEMSKAIIENELRSTIPEETVNGEMQVSQLDMTNIEQQLRKHLSEAEVNKAMQAFPSDISKIEKSFRELMPDKADEEVDEAMRAFLSEMVELTVGILKPYEEEDEETRISRIEKENLEKVLREFMPEEKVDEAIRSGNIPELEDLVKNLERPTATGRTEQPIQYRNPLKVYKFLDGSFTKKTTLGSGAQGFVCKCKHEVFGDVAMKKFIKQANRVCTEEQREFLITSRMVSHRAIVAFYGYVYDSPDGPPTGYVMECLDTSLDKVIFRKEGSSLPDITRDDAYGIIFKIAAGLEYLHRDRLIHRDVKPHNILVSLDFEKVKLCDYGTSRLRCRCPWKEHDSECSDSKVVDEREGEGPHEARTEGCGWKNDYAWKKTTFTNPEIDNVLKSEHSGFGTFLGSRPGRLAGSDSAEGDEKEGKKDEQEVKLMKEKRCQGHQEEGVAMDKEGGKDGAEKPWLTDGVGTVIYTAPEVLEYEKVEYTEKCDVYSFAITAWEILHKRPAFTGSFGKIAKEVTEGDRPSLEDMTIDSTVRSILERAWHPDPDVRPPMLEIKKELAEIYVEERLPDLVMDFRKRKTCVGTLNCGYECKEVHKHYEADFGAEETEQLTQAHQLSAHPNLVSLYELSYNLRTYTGYTMEYLPLSLDKVIYKNADDNSLPEYSMEEAVEMIRKMCRGLIYLHQQGVLHRNVKPSNVLLSRNLQTVKLSDYGIWTTQGAIRDQQYHAPELLQRYHEDRTATFPKATFEYSEKCDVYSAALSFWELFHRRSPILDKTNEEFEAMSLVEDIIGMKILCKVVIEQGKRPSLENSELNLKWRQLLERAWHNDPDERPTILEFARSIDDCVAEA